MAEGFDAPPRQLLARFFGKELSPPNFVETDIAAIREKVTALGRLYRTLDAPRNAP